MGLDDIDSPEKLYDWVKFHSASDEVYDAFCDLVLETVHAVRGEESGDEFDCVWDVSNGIVHRSDGTNPTAYFLTVTIEDMDVTLMYGLLWDDQLGKFTEVSFIPGDIPVERAHGLLH